MRCPHDVRWISSNEQSFAYTTPPRAPSLIPPFTCVIVLLTEIVFILLCRAVMSCQQSERHTAAATLIGVLRSSSNVLLEEALP